MKRLTDQEKDAEGYEDSEEEELEEPRKPIWVNHFLHSNVKWWIQQAQQQWQDGQHALSFICAWIAFNQVYGLAWTNLSPQLSRGGRKVRLHYLSGDICEENLREYTPDNVQIASFIGKQNPGFAIFWKRFLATKGDTLVKKIKLPVLHLEKNDDVPDSTPREVRLIDLEVPTLFRVLLTIRNNLFHGGKRFTTQRDLDVCSCAAEFMVPFVTELTKSIEGVG